MNETEYITTKEVLERIKLKITNNLPLSEFEQEIILLIAEISVIDKENLLKKFGL